MPYDSVVMIISVGDLFNYILENSCPCQVDKTREKLSVGDVYWIRKECVWGREIGQGNWLRNQTSENLGR